MNAHGYDKLKLNGLSYFHYSWFKKETVIISKNNTTNFENFILIL